MQAIIMAAGKGSRLGELAADKPKSFLEIKGKSLIDINVQILKSHGVDNITIVTGCHAEKFEEKYAGDSKVHLVYNPFYSFMNVLGSFFMGMGELQDDFVYMHADTIFEPSILLDLLNAQGAMVLPVDAHRCDEEAMKVKLENGRVRYISKKLDPEECAGEFIGVAKIKKEVLPSLKDHTKKLLRNGMFAEYFEAALQEVLAEGIYGAELIPVQNRFWAEIDDMADYQRAEKNIIPSLYQF